MKILSLTEFSRIVKYSRRTIFKKIKDGSLKPYQIRNGRNFFLESQAKLFLNTIETTKERVSVGYTRVSSNSQKNHLVDQEKLIEIFAASKGIILLGILSDLGSGINFNRKNFLNIIDSILNREIDKIVITYEDRLTRFGFSLIKYIADKCGTEIIVINAKSTSPEKELVEDLMTIIHVFSARLYGLHSNKKKIKEITDELCSKSENTPK
jgi:putative resolvase